MIKKSDWNSVIYDVFDICDLPIVIFPASVERK